MASETGKAFDAAAIAAALNAATESYEPEPKYKKEMMAKEPVFSAIKAMKQKNMPTAKIVDLLAENGIKTTVQTFNRYWNELTGEGDAKQGRKPRAAKPRTASGTSEGTAANKPAADATPAVKPEGTGSTSTGSTPAERLAAKTANNATAASEAKPNSNAAYRDRKSL